MALSEARPTSVPTAATVQPGSFAWCAAIEPRLGELLDEAFKAGRRPAPGFCRAAYFDGTEGRPGLRPRVLALMRNNPLLSRRELVAQCLGVIFEMMQCYRPRCSCLSRKG
jgi:hypothetical protein